MHHSKLDVDVLVGTDVLLSKSNEIPRGRTLTIDSQVSTFRQSAETVTPWVLVVLGTLKISTLAEVSFAQGKVCISSDGMLVLDGIAAFEALSLGKDCNETSINTIKDSLTRTCVTGSGAFSTLLRSMAGYDASVFEIFCDFSPIISFVFIQRREENYNLPFTEVDFDPSQPHVSAELTLLIGLQFFRANFDSIHRGNIFGFMVNIHQTNGKFLDLQINNLRATKLNVAGQIRISEANFKVYRLEISGSGSGVALVKGASIWQLLTLPLCLFTHI